MYSGQDCISTVTMMMLASELWKMLVGVTWEESLQCNTHI